MPVSKQFILSKLPDFRNERVTRAEKQEVLRDIIPVMLNAHKRNGWLYDKIGIYFVGADIDATCRNIYNFCKENLRYDEEPDNLQTVSVPQGLLTAGHCDCKGFASFISGCLSAISRLPGQKIKWHYCFASYKILKQTPYHVFSVVDTATGPIWIDPTPGSANENPIWWMNRTVKNSDMALEEVIGSVYDKSGGQLGSLRPGNRIPSLAFDQQQLAASVLLQSTGATDTSITNAPPVVNPVLTIVPPVPPPADNITEVPQAGFMQKLGITNKQLLFGIGGLTVLYFATKRKKKVSGIGKKDKNIVPLVIGISALGLGYWWYTKNKTAAAVPGNTGIVPPLNPGDIVPGSVSTIPGAFTGERTAQAIADFWGLTGFVTEQKRLQFTALDNTEIHQVVNYLMNGDNTGIAAIESKYGFLITRS